MPDNDDRIKELAKELQELIEKEVPYSSEEFMYYPEEANLLLALKLYNK